MRRRAAPKRQILPDPKYGDLVLAKFVNILMLDGKKSVAEKIVYDALDTIESKGNAEPVETFKKALEKVNSYELDHKSQTYHFLKSIIF